MTLKKHFIASVFVLVLGLVVSTFALFPSQVSAENFDWVKKIGGANNEYVYSTITDSDGNIYVSGSFSGTVDFNPGEGDSSLTSAGSSDIYILKLDSDSNFVWVKQIGSIGADAAYSMTLGENGNLCVAGTFSGTVNFNPDGAMFNLVSSGARDIFINKLDSDGNFVWAKKLGGADPDSEVVPTDSIAVDQEDGSVYTTGYFAGTADFDPGAGTANLTAPQWGRSMFISKLDINGDFAWVKQIDSIYSYSIDLDLNGDVYVTGIFSGTKDFDPGNAINLISSGNNDVFILKLATNGDFVWVKQIGGAGADDSRFAVVDQGGNIYTVGTFAGTVDFNPGEGGFSLTSAGGSDMFISKLDIDGNFVWAKQIGGATTTDRIQSISLGPNGYFYIAGEFGGTIDFDPGEAISNLVTASDYDIFISKLDTDGNFIWAKQFGQTGYEYAHVITANQNEDVYIIGRFNGIVDFNPGSEGSSLTSVGYEDIFILKLISDVVIITPTLTTNEVTSITTTTATFNANVIDNGGEDVEVGFKYGKTEEHGTDINVDGTYATGASFLSEVVGLTCGTTYHVEAFASNSNEEGGNGGDVTFITSACPVEHHSHVTGSSAGAIARFQAEQQVPPTAPVTPPTSVITPTPSTTGTPLNLTRTLKLNMTGDDIKALQVHLNTHGFPVSLTGAGSLGNETTFFGPRTKLAVMAFQKANGLTPDGIVGPKTLEKMK